MKVYFLDEIVRRVIVTVWLEGAEASQCQNLQKFLILGSVTLLQIHFTIKRISDVEKL